MRFHLKTHKSKAQAAEYILNLPEMPVMEANIIQYSRKRSTEANARHWSLLSQVSYWMARRGEDHSTEVWHLYFLNQFQEPETNIVNGKLLKRHTSTKMTSFEFNEHCNEVEAWCGDNEITLMDLEQWREFRKNA